MDRILDCVVPAVLGGLCGILGTWLRLHKARQTANDVGTQCLLRAEIIRDYKEYREKGYCPIYAKESLEKAYNAYSKLGGNDVAKKMYEYMIALPDGAEEEKHDL